MSQQQELIVTRLANQAVDEFGKNTVSARATENLFRAMQWIRR